MYTLSQQQYDNLFSRWQSARPDYFFVHDGIINEKEYGKANPRILFLLKESNDDFTEVATKDGTINPTTGSSTLFWRKINIIKYVIQKAWKGETTCFSEIETYKNELIKGIAYVNIKKNAQNKSITDERDLSSYAKKDASFLQEQIALLSPQVVVCGGTIKQYDMIYPEGCETLTYRTHFQKNKLVIDAYHPSYEGESFEQLYNWLSESLINKAVQQKILSIN